MPNWVPSWPTKDEYDEAMKKWRDTLGDPELRNAELSMLMGDTPTHYERGGLYAVVYKVGKNQVRCFCSDVSEQRDPPADIIQRYVKISAYIAGKQRDAPALIETIPDLNTQGIFVAGRWWPVIKTKWLTDISGLGRYINANHNDANAMRALSDSWRIMIRQLEAAQIAHGDLDVTNVLVQRVNGQPTLRLVDYDNMWVPALDGYLQTECGHEAFQHPVYYRPVGAPLTRNRPYNQEMDRFSALVIYLSLLALSIRGSLYDELGAREEQRLLFSRDDYENYGQTSSNIQRVQAKCGHQVTPYVQELMACLRERRMPRTLDTIARESASSTPSNYSPLSSVKPPPMAKPGSNLLRTKASSPGTPSQGTTYTSTATSTPGSYTPPPSAASYQPAPSYQRPASRYAPKQPSPALGTGETNVARALIITGFLALCIIVVCILVAILRH